MACLSHGGVQMYRVSLALCLALGLVACSGASTVVVQEDNDQPSSCDWGRWLVVDFQRPAVVAVAPGCEMRLKQVDPGVFRFPENVGGAYRIVIVQGNDVVAVAQWGGKTIPLSAHVGKGENSIQEAAGITGTLVQVEPLPIEPLPPLRTE